MMTHLWLRAESRPNEARTGLMPDGAAALIAAGTKVTVEDSPSRVIPTSAYLEAGATIAPEHTWPAAPQDAIILGLKELPDDGTPLRHRHIMFGHAYKGQPAGKILLGRFRAGGGTLYDLEYLVDPVGVRVAAFGYWAGYAGAAVALKCWLAQVAGERMGAVTAHDSSTTLLADLQDRMRVSGRTLPSVIIVGALGRVGTGASDLCRALGIPVAAWDMAETAHGGPFPEILDHDIFLNCILARPGTPVFVPKSAVAAPRRLTVIGDIACDPDSEFSPIKIYDRTTTWAHPALRVHETPPLDVTAIDNLPSMLPAESSQDFATQLLPSLQTLANLDGGVWARAKAEFDHHIARIQEATR